MSPYFSSESDRLQACYHAVLKRANQHETAQAQKLPPRVGTRAMLCAHLSVRTTTQGEGKSAR